MGSTVRLPVKPVERTIVRFYIRMKRLLQAILLTYKSGEPVEPNPTKKMQI